MSTIGTFTKQEDSFNGTLHTLTFNVRVKIVPITKIRSRVWTILSRTGAMEIGAAWKRQSKANKPYISVKLDDPSFATPVNGGLVDGEAGTVNLHWSRRSDE